MSKFTRRLKNSRLTRIPPTRLIVFSFFTLISVGTFLLTLPMASADGKSIGFLDALFTSTSASCVTGLAIADTYAQWSLFGQIVILILIQAGGLGIITLATFFSVVMRRKLSFKSQVLAQESMNQFTYAGIFTLIKRVVIATFIIEFIGFVLLSIRFVPRYGSEGLYMGLFHAISAYCNAGFDIIGKRSLSDFNGDPVILYTIMGLIILGGLGFFVLQDVYVTRKFRNLYLHTKIVLITTSALIVLGTLFFFALEAENPLTMGPLNFFEKINASLFHSVTSRTAGFYSVSTDGMYDTSKIMTVFLMFIGAAPGSTAGGIKVTTFAVIIMSIISYIRGLDETLILKRHVSSRVVNKSLSIIGLSILLIFIATTILLVVEDFSYVNILYEVTSAFGTVGLSTGITPELHPLSKSILILTMFLGRVGPITFAVALAMKSNKKEKNTVYPEGKIVVG